MREGSWTRRSVLTTGAGAVLAGCAGRSAPSSEGSTGEDLQTTGGGGVFEDISFDGGSMVVQLRDGHDVSQVNLIAPNGTSFAQAAVPVGATTARLRVLDIEPMGAGFEHYTPGTHKLIAVIGERSISLELDLRPEIGIVAVKQPEDSTRGSQYGQIRVTVRNSGSAPTWVYGIVYRDAPNFAANDTLSSDPGSPQLTDLDRVDDAIVGPAEEKSFTGGSPPLLFDDSEMERCDAREYEFTVVVGTAVGGAEEAQLRATTGGDVVSAGLAGEYTCSEISPRVIDAGVPE
jgi:hypothetical protein